MCIEELSKEELIKALAEMVIQYISDDKISEIKSKHERVSVEEAAEVLGISNQLLRLKMKDNSFDPPIGQAVKCGTKYEYLIYRSKLMKYIGKE